MSLADAARPSLLVPPPPRKYRLFISHAWRHTDEYDALVKLIEPGPDFDWQNLSVPKTRPIEVFELLRQSYRYLVNQLDAEIKRAECFLVLAGMYAAHSGWIQSEMEAAKEFSIPIIAVLPRGNERFPEAVTHAAVEQVAWYRSSIIGAVHRRARPMFPTIASATLPPPFPIG